MEKGEHVGGKTNPERQKELVTKWGATSVMSRKTRIQIGDVLKQWSPTLRLGITLVNADYPECACRYKSIF